MPGSMRAAQYSHWLLSSPPRRESCPGGPSMIESPSATTTVGPSASGIGLLGDLRGGALALPDEVVGAPAVDHLVDVRLLVAGIDGEVGRVGPQLLVLLPGHRDALDAGRVAALADEVQQLVLETEVVGEVADPLVHLAEDRLVQPNAFLARAHGTTLWSSGGSGSPGRTRLARSWSLTRFARAARRRTSKALSTSSSCRSARIPLACSIAIRDFRAPSSCARRPRLASVTARSRATAADASSSVPVS